MKENDKTGNGKRHTGNIHNDFFSEQFETKAQAESLLRLAFGPQQLALFDLDTIRLEPKRWTRLKDSDAPNSQEADLLLSVRLKEGKRVTVSIVIEHKSSDDNKLMGQLLLYQKNCFERDAPAVIPIALYHGKTKGFPRYRTFQHYQQKRLKVPAGLINLFSRNMIDFEPVVINLTDEDTFRSLTALPLSAQVPLSIMGRVWTADPKTIANAAEQCAPLPEIQRMALVRQCAIYLCAVRREYKIGDLMRYINEQLPGDSAMQELAKEWNWVKRPDIVEEGKRIGLKEGRQQGLQEKAHEVAEKLLQEGMSAQKISSITGLDVRQINGLPNSN